LRLAGIGLELPVQSSKKEIGYEGIEAYPKEYSFGIQLF
jgi:hypothetical protein